MDKPTEAQIKEFWKWCGFKIERIPDETPFYVLYEPNEKSPKRRGEQYNIWIGRYRGAQLEVEKLYPDIDLNNLFKYAVPKLEDKYELDVSEDIELLGKSVCLHSIMNRGCSAASPIVYFKTWDEFYLALFWALWQVKDS